MFQEKNRLFLGPLKLIRNLNTKYLREFSRVIFAQSKNEIVVHRLLEYRDRDGHRSTNLKNLETSDGKLIEGNPSMSEGLTNASECEADKIIHLDSTVLV